MNPHSAFAKILALAGIFVSFLAGCRRAEGTPSALSVGSVWNYNETDDVYWQVGLQYAAKPADIQYGTLGIFVPGAYFDGKLISEGENNGKYSVSPKKGAKVGSFDSENAPFVMPIETPGYAALSSPTEYASAVKKYTDEGMIFVYSGARGRDQGAPLGVTDFKAAIRYVRHNAKALPGDTSRFFTYGMSGGGAQSALLGATGDAPEYEPYLKAVGAVMDESDAVTGSMDWCPITNLNVANEAYEWELGASRENLDEKMKLLSDSLALRFAEYVNALGLKDENGNALTLEQSADGLFHVGPYYDYLKQTVENSLNEFLAAAKFPYNVEKQKSDLGQEMLTIPPFMRGGNGGGRPPKEMGEGKMPPQNGINADFEERDNVKRTARAGGITLSGTYNSAEEYVDSLNAKGTWVSYDKNANTATVSSLADFTKFLKNATKSVGAFDDLSSAQGENTLFGYADGKGAHWDGTMAKVLEPIDPEKAAEYKADLSRKDALGSTVQTRIDMYNPMYYLSPYYRGFKTARPAKFWRIRSGIFQGDTAVSTELDYALALESYGNEVESVDFKTIWGLYHVEAESLYSGSASDNFIRWVKECLKG